MALVPAEIEGPIASVDPDPNGNDAILKVMGMTVIVRKAAADARRIRTPTNKRLTIAELVLKTSLPGQMSEGFVGGTAIVVGNFNTETGNLEVDFPVNPNPSQAAGTFEPFPVLEIGPPENLILGPITQPSGTDFTVNGVIIRRLDGSDSRLPGDPPRNEFGFDITVESIKPGMPASVEGYLSEVDSKIFRGVNFVVDDPATVLTTTTPQVSITRAQARNRGAEFDIDFRGGVTTAHVAGGVQNVFVYRTDTQNGDENNEQNFLGRAQARVIAGGFAKWRLSTSITSSSAPYDVAPRSIIAINRDVPGATKPSAREEDVDVRDG